MAVPKDTWIRLLPRVPGFEEATSVEIVKMAEYLVELFSEAGQNHRRENGLPLPTLSEIYQKIREQS